MKFINRHDELKALRERLDSDKFELIIIYGRRRIGKTRLILEAVKGRKYIYYLAVETDNLRRFKENAARSVPEVKYAADDWEAVLHFLKNRIIIIDEFPNLIHEDKAVTSLLQKIVDENLLPTKTKLVLLGSSISMMTSRVLSYKSPLYGRKTASLKLKPLRFTDLKDFFPKASWREIVEIYGFADGIPYYLENIKLPFWEWLDSELKRPDSFIKYEADFLLKYEFEEVSTYKRILEALAFGKTRLGEIRDYVRTVKGDITSYLRNLIETGFIVREVPVTEGPLSKRGRYYIKDNFLRFWFRFIYPNLSVIEEGIYQASEIKEEYDEYLGPVFEKVARELIVRLIKTNKLPLSPNKIGKWWYKDTEIDLVAIDTHTSTILFLEAKWSRIKRRDTYRLLTSLEKKAKQVKWRLDKRKEYYALVAREIEEKENLRKELGNNILLYDLNDIEPSQAK